jgi:hypothetical protein
MITGNRTSPAAFNDPIITTFVALAGSRKMEKNNNVVVKERISRLSVKIGTINDAAP